MRATVDGSRVRDFLLRVGRAWPARLDRRWLVAHLVTLAAVLAVLLYAARGQYFYYDEWDFLAARAEWDLLASHVGHLSLFPQLITTVIKLAVGLHSYWPYLIPTIVVHLVVVHLLWRMTMRLGANALVALVVAALFGVLAPAAENTLWAFQLGFVTPLALGFGAVLIAMRPTVTRRDLVAIGALLTVSVGFSGTAIPMIVVTAAVLALRHGWRATLAPVGVPLVVYATWYVVFNRGPHDWDAFRADSPWEILIGVPRFIAHGFVDSVGDMLPLAALAPVVLVLLLGWMLARFHRLPWRATDVAVLLVAGALVFAGLTALSRVGLGDDAASAGRYAYVYGLLLAPAVALALTAVAGARLGALAVVVTLVGVTLAYNAGGLVVAGQEQGAQERSVPRAMSAALQLVGCDQGYAHRHPSPRIAPTLTMADVCSFVDRGQFTPVDFTAADVLDVRIGLMLEARRVDAPSPTVGECELPDIGGAYAYDPATDLIGLPADAQLIVNADLDGAYTQYAAVYAPAGVSALEGLDDDLDMRLSTDLDICVFSR